MVIRLLISFGRWGTCIALAGPIDILLNRHLAPSVESMGCCCDCDPLANLSNCRIGNRG